jgi:hypothetical protein
MTVETIQFNSLHLYFSTYIYIYSTSLYIAYERKWRCGPLFHCADYVDNVTVTMITSCEIKDTTNIQHLQIQNKSEIFGGRGCENAI